MKLVKDNNKFILESEEYKVELFEIVDNITHINFNILNSYIDNDDMILNLVEFKHSTSNECDYEIMFMLQIFDYEDDFYQQYHKFYIVDIENFKHEVLL